MKPVKDKTTDSSELLKELTELSMLYDFYSELLDEHKKSIFGEYVMNDLSFTEIGEDTGISRQAVYDIIRRTSAQLREYEEKLGLIKKYREIEAGIGRLKNMADRIERAGDPLSAAELRRVTEEIRSVL